jgi:hypothetical protein
MQFSGWSSGKDGTASGISGTINTYVTCTGTVGTTTANKADTFGFICTGTNTYYGYIVGQNL